MKQFIKLTTLGCFLFSCTTKNETADATGSFEAIETIISAEANGKLMQFTAHEGDEIKAGQQIGYIDSTQLHLTRLQLLQSQKALLSGRPDINTQLEALESEL